MKFRDISKALSGKTFFTSSDVSVLTGCSAHASRMLCHRYVASGLFLRIKRDIYVRADVIARYDIKELFQIANRLQVPSYVSLLSALAYHEVTTQVPRSLVESIAIKRSRVFACDDIRFAYYKIAPARYYGFEKRNGCFIATKEKALVDAVYLSVMGHYGLDMNAVDFSKMSRPELKKELKQFPEIVHKKVAAWMT